MTDEVRYRFHPGTSELAQTMSRLVACYRTDGAAVVRVAAIVQKNRATAG